MPQEPSDPPKKGGKKGRRGASKKGKGPKKPPARKASKKRDQKRGGGAKDGQKSARERRAAARRRRMSGDDDGDADTTKAPKVSPRALRAQKRARSQKPDAKNDANESPKKKKKVSDSDGASDAKGGDWKCPVDGKSDKEIESIPWNRIRSVTKECRSHDTGVTSYEWPKKRLNKAHHVEYLKAWRDALHKRRQTDASQSPSGSSPAAKSGAGRSTHDEAEVNGASNDDSISADPQDEREEMVPLFNMGLGKRKKKPRARSRPPSSQSPPRANGHSQLPKPPSSPSLSPAPKQGGSDENSADRPRANGEHRNSDGAALPSSPKDTDASRNGANHDESSSSNGAHSPRSSPKDGGDANHRSSPSRRRSPLKRRSDEAKNGNDESNRSPKKRQKS